MVGTRGLFEWPVIFDVPPPKMLKPGPKLTCKKTTATHNSIRLGSMGDVNPR